MCPIARQDSYERPLASTVADRLKSARRRRFVGRTAELELFVAALAAPEPPFSVLWIHGPGGVGKTALLSTLAEAAADAGVGVVSLDLRAIEPSPPAFMAELGRALGMPPGAVSTGSACWPRACGAAAGHPRGCGRARGLAARAVRPGAAGVMNNCHRDDAGATPPRCGTCSPGSPGDDDLGPQAPTVRSPDTTVGVGRRACSSGRD